MKHIILILLLFALSGCSMRKSAMLQGHSSSSELSETIESTGRIDTTWIISSDTIRTDVSLNEVARSGAKGFRIKTKHGELKLTLKDSILIAEAIWSERKEHIVIPATYRKQSVASKSKSDTITKQEKKVGNPLLRFWWIVPILIIIVLLIVKKYVKWPFLM